MAAQHFRLIRNVAGSVAATAASGFVFLWPLPEPSLPEQRCLSLSSPRGDATVTVLGVAHTSDDSAREARRAVEARQWDAVALETDVDTLRRIRVAYAAVRDMDPFTLRHDGAATLRSVLFDEERARRHAAGGEEHSLTSPEQVVLPVDLLKWLYRGKLYSREMAEAAEAAERAGVPVRCIDMPPGQRSPGAAAEAPKGLLHWREALAYVGTELELRARFFARWGTLTLEDVLVTRRRHAPEWFEATVRKRDAHMAAAVLELCAAVPGVSSAQAERDAGEGGVTGGAVLVICGAAHLDGIANECCRRGMHVLSRDKPAWMNFADDG